MRISFTLTKEYEIFIDKEEVDKKYGGSVRDAVNDKIKEAEETDSFLDDTEILEEEYEYQDILYEDLLEDEYRAEKELQDSQYYRDLI